ncbi:hypothetical protein C5E11_11715 [Clavibacter michiganensis]|nr:hypothetical protein [Clavibacter michiganensis]PPF62209.1 hypothetical protein C5E11_11715 [Clavibacter michiganensis]
MTDEATAPAGDPNTPQPAAATPPTAGPPSVFARAFGPQRLLPMFLPVATTLVVGYVLGLLATILTVVSIDEPRPWSLVAALPLQLLGAGLFGTITGSVSAGAMGLSVSGSVFVFVVPLLFLLVQAGSLAVTSHVAERRVPSDAASVRWITALTQGLSYSILITVLALVGSIAYSSEGVTFSVTTASVSLFAGALVIMTLSAVIGRASTPGARREAKPFGVGLRLPAALSSALWIALGYAIAASLIVGIALIIGVTVQSGPRALLSAPLWLPTAAVDALAVMHFGQLSAGGTLTQTMGTDTPSSIWIGSADPWVVVVDVVLVIVLVAVAGTLLRALRASRPMTPVAAWASTVGAFALVGLLVSLFGSAAASGSVGGFVSGSLTAGPAAYTFLLFAALGALVEVVSRYVAGYVLGVLPAGFVARLNRVALRLASSTPPASLARPAVSVAPFAGAPEVGEPVVTDPNAATSAPATTASPAVTTSAANPLDPRTKKRVVVGSIVAGSVIVVAVLASVGLSIANGVVNAPQAKVSEYLDALVEGDASRALQLSDVDAPNSERLLLDDEIFRAAAGRITSYDITSVTTSGDTANVTAEVDQDGSKATMRFTVESRGKHWLFFDDWKLDRPEQSTLPVYIDESLDQVEVNGVPIELSDEQRGEGLSLIAFPGRYDFSISKSSRWLTAEPVSGTIMAGSVLGSTNPVALEPEATPGLTEEISKQVDAYLAECIASTSLEPDNCPNDLYYSYGNPTNVVWSLTEAPEYEIRISYDGTMAVTTTKTGSASVTYKYTSGGERDGSNTTTIRVSGDVKIDGDKATFVPDSNGY